MKQSLRSGPQKDKTGPFNKLYNIISTINNHIEKNKNNPLLLKENNKIAIEYNKENYALIKKLAQEGLITNFIIIKKSIKDFNLKGSVQKKIEFNIKTLINSSIDSDKDIKLKWHISQISKPGRKIYITWKELLNYTHIFERNTNKNKYKFGSKYTKLKIYLLRTSKGILTENEAIKLQIGGELLSKIEIKLNNNY